MSSNDSQKKIPTRRPATNKIRQQNLHAWQPLLTAWTALSAFFIIAVVFIPVGVVIFLLNIAKEYKVDYTDCQQMGGNGTTCYELLASNVSGSCQCQVNFTLEQDLKGEVCMYYELTNFFQNFRLYAKSRDDKQLLGKLSKEVDSACKPFDISDDGKPIAPCGAAANAFFNDTLTISNQETDIKLLNIGIAWASDKKRRFRNPEGDLKEKLKDFSKPINWKKNIYDLDPDNPDNNGFQNEDFIVWMRPAALSSFKKLYRRIDQPYGLRAGDYTLNVNYQYPVQSFSGTKSMVLGTVSCLGGPNLFTAIAFFVMGFLFIFLGLILLFLHIRWKQHNEYLVSINPETGLSSAAEKRASFDSMLTY